MSRLILVGLVCASVGLGCWIMWIDMSASAGHGDGIAPQGVPVGAQYDAPCNTADGRLVDCEPCFVQPHSEVKEFVAAPCNSFGAIPLSQAEARMRQWPKAQVTWLGSPVVSNPVDWPGMPCLPAPCKAEAPVEQYDIGLREDGVVVWRKKEE